MFMSFLCSANVKPSKDVEYCSDVAKSAGLLRHKACSLNQCRATAIRVDITELSSWLLVILSLRFINAIIMADREKEIEDDVVKYYHTHLRKKKVTANHDPSLHEDRSATLTEM
jgi:hypothetical protein